MKHKILAQVLEIMKTYSGGVKFFDELDKQIMADEEIILALLKTVPKDHFIVLSGGFGRKVAEGIDAKKYPPFSYFLYKGGLRGNNLPELLRVKMFRGKMLREGIFLDDSIYGGLTYEKIKAEFTEERSLEKVSVIYDGCPVKKSYVNSLFRYYDHFQTEPNFKF